MTNDEILDIRVRALEDAAIIADQCAKQNREAANKLHVRSNRLAKIYGRSAADDADQTKISAQVLDACAKEAEHRDSHPRSKAQRAREGDAMTDEYFLIYDTSHGLYWRANSCGYTAHTWDAGRYSKEECDDIAASLDRTLRIEPAPTPSQSNLGDALALVEHLKRRLAETEQQRDFHFEQIVRARDHITALTLYRERLVCFISKTTSDQRDRIHELSGNDCDYDRSVRELLADFRALSTLAAQDVRLAKELG